jgi:hypothetical protein
VNTVYEYFKKAPNGSGLSAQAVMKYLNDQINSCLETYDDAMIEISFHNLLRMASRSSTYNTKVNNPRFEKFLRSERKDAYELYNRWTPEEISVMLKKMTEFNLNKGSERLDEYMSHKLYELSDEYRKKPYVVKNFLQSIV